MGVRADPFRVAILGCGWYSEIFHFNSIPDSDILGFMGTALLDGFLRKPNLPRGAALQLAACVRSKGSVERLQQHLGDRADRVELGHGDDAVRLTERAHMILLGCRPQDLGSMLSTANLPQTFAGKTIVSMLAGLSCQQISGEITSKGGPDDATVVRVMPSIGAMYNSYVSLIAGPNSDAQEVAEEIFAQVGTTLPVSEDLLNKGTAVGAVGHALALHAVDAMTDASVAEGVPRDIAASLAQQYLRSASSCMENGLTPEQLKAALSTPKGITLNAAVQLEKGGARIAIIDATRGAIQYAESM